MCCGIISLNLLILVQVWFKADLRIDDHPGLKLVETAFQALPVFCFDANLYTQLIRTPNGLEGNRSHHNPPAHLMPLAKVDKFRLNISSICCGCADVLQRQILTSGIGSWG